MVELWGVRRLTCSWPERGLHFNAEKSMVWCPGHDQGDDDPLERGIPRVRKGGVKLLGSPVGRQLFEREVLVDRISKLEALLEKLPTLEDPHTEYVLLKNCFGLPKHEDCGPPPPPGHSQEV